MSMPSMPMPSMTMPGMAGVGLGRGWARVFQLLAQGKELLRPPLPRCKGKRHRQGQQWLNRCGNRMEVLLARQRRCRWPGIWF